jgi:hypothetical protein
MERQKIYQDRFTAAVDKSDHWQCTGDDDFEPEMPPNATLKTYLEAVDFFIDQHGPETIVRTRCAPIHFHLWLFLRSCGLPSIITIGDIAWNGAREFGTAYGKLKREWRGTHMGSDKTFDAHVWLTLPNGETVIDVTALPYLMREVPTNFSWKDSIYISGYVHWKEPLEHIPFLVGVNFLLKSGAVEIAT